MSLVLLNASVLNPKLVFVKYMANTEICDKMFDILLTSSPVMENMARNVSLAVLDWYNGIMVYGPHYGVIGEQLHEAGNNSLLGQCGERKRPIGGLLALPCLTSQDVYLCRGTRTRPE